MRLTTGDREAELDDFVIVTVRSGPAEPADAFNKRLIAFWSGMVRAKKADYERVYAETSRFASDGDQLTRQYMVGSDVAAILVRELAAAGLLHDPIDPDDLYSKFEATPPEWFQIPH